jgi:hypothetical protein
MPVNNWTEDQLKLAFSLYMQTPFGRLHKGNPEIIALAKLTGRTPSAVAMKLVNFASLDPSIVNSGRKGMGNASALDRKVWDAFQADWEGLAFECENILQKYQLDAPAAVKEDFANDDIAELADYSGETRRVVSEQRKKQSFFRKAVPSSYGNACCMTGLAEPKLLIASHIVPWSQDKKNRLNPSNGLCLSALHDRAFDGGLIGVRSDFSIVVSKAVKKLENNVYAQSALLSLEGKSINLPDRFLPSASFLEHHYTSIFLG